MTGTENPVSARRRTAAVLSLVATAAAAVWLLALVVTNLLALVVAVAGLMAALAGFFKLVLARNAKRVLGFVGIGVGAVLVLWSIDHTSRAVESAGFRILVLLALTAIAIASGRIALRRDLAEAALDPNWRRTTPPVRAVLFLNPKSGGGKVEQFDLQRRAEEVGVRAVLFGAEHDLRELAEQAVAEGADCLGAAGGDGSLAIVASVASAHDLPFVCVPAGTRNHFALDLGLDRNDPPAALAAFRDGVERRIDTAQVGEHFFLNNVSLGLYGQLVQDERYRDDKLGTTLEVLGDLVEEGGEPYDLHFEGPDGEQIEGAYLIQVSNNPYTLSRLTDFGQRLRLDTGMLGIIVLRGDRGVLPAALVALAATNQLGLSDAFVEWEAPTFEVVRGQGDTATDRVWVGLDGEAVEIETPVRFQVHPLSLRVLVPMGNLRVAELRRSRDVSVAKLVQLARGVNPDA
jgi:diacylglycerol kinase family enzyme